MAELSVAARSDSQTAARAALRLDIALTAREADVATRASSGADLGGPRCMALHRGPRRILLHPHRLLSLLRGDFAAIARARPGLAPLCDVDDVRAPGDI